MAKEIFEGLSLDNIDSVIDLNFNNDVEKKVGGNTTQLKENEINIEEENRGGLFEDPVMEEQIKLMERLKKNSTKTNKQIEEEKNNQSTEKEESKDKKEIPLVSNKETKSDEVTKDFPLIPYINSLLEAGVLPNFNKEEFSKIETSEEQAQYLIDSQEEEVKNRAESILEQYVNTLPPKIKAIFNNYSGGLNVDSAFGYAEKLDRLNSITPESLDDNIELCKRVIKEDLIEQGLDEEDVLEHIDNMVTYTEPAKKSLERRIKRINGKIVEEQKIAETKEKEDVKEKESQLKRIKNHIETIPEIIPGIQLTPQLRKEIYETMMIPVGKDNYGQSIGRITEERLKDPILFDTKLSQIFVLTKGFSDLKALINIKNTKAIKELEEKLKSDKPSEGRPVYEEDSNDKNDLLTRLKKYNSI